MARRSLSTSCRRPPQTMSRRIDRQLRPHACQPAPCLSTRPSTIRQRDNDRWGGTPGDRGTVIGALGYGGCRLPRHHPWSGAMSHGERKTASGRCGPASRPPTTSAESAWVLLFLSFSVSDNARSYKRFTGGR